MSREIKTPMMDKVHSHSNGIGDKPFLTRTDAGKDRLTFCAASLTKRELRELIRDLQKAERMMK